jgi:hypothetical protein
MASVIYTRGMYAAFVGAIDLDTDAFKALLTTSSYTENKDQDYRDSVTNEIGSGGGYTTGGNTVTVTVTLDDTNDRVDVSLGGTSWGSSTITAARKAIYYRARGGASSADELIFCNDFGADLSTVGGTLTLAASTLRIQN